MTGKFNSYSKEVIKARMLQNATKIWGLKSIHSLDPFVVLLIDAFSAELFKVSNEVQSINSRILEKLAKMLTPSMYTYPKPAHAIAFGSPEIATEMLPGHSEFFVKKQFASTTKAVSDIQIEIPFTPVDNIPLHKLQATILLAGQTCYTMDEHQNKIPVARLPEYVLPHNKLILGIDVSKYDAEHLPEALNMYCANPTFEHLDFVYKLLPYASAQCNNIALSIAPGLQYASAETKPGFDGIFEDFAIRTRIEDNIKNIYKHKFIELKGFRNEMISDRLPELLGFLAEKRELSGFIEGKKFLWLEFSFPPQFTAELIEGFSMVLNAFPVYNKAWKSNQCTLDVMGNNIPLFTGHGEHYLFVDDVIDSFGRHYSEIPFTRSEALEKGYYTVRSGGMERFSERNALDLIAHVLELTRDEVSAFGVLERDKVVEALKNMTLQMKALEQKVKTSSKLVAENINYIIVDPVGEMEHIKATYWVTHATLANHIRANTKLVQQKINYSNINKSITLLTETVGGGEEQKGTDAIQAYKYALTTRDKIVSMEDIRNYCRMMLKGEMKSIDVKRGTIISTKPKEGFIRSVEITIVPRVYRQFGKQYWENMATTLKRQIEMRAIDGVEYLVAINDKDEQEFK